MNRSSVRSDALVLKEEADRLAVDLREDLEFDRVDSALADLALLDEGLRLADTACHIALAQPGFRPGLAQAAEHSSIATRM